MHGNIRYISVDILIAVVLGEIQCGTLWGKREQAIHCGIELLYSEGFTSEVSDHITNAVACSSTRSVTLLSVRVLNSLAKIVMIERMACHRVRSTIQWSHYSYLSSYSGSL